MLHTVVKYRYCVLFHVPTTNHAYSTIELEVVCFAVNDEALMKVRL